MINLKSFVTKKANKIKKTIVKIIFLIEKL